MEIQITSKDKVVDWVHLLHDANPGMAIGLLLSGDRWSCVEEVVLAVVKKKIVGIATIAPLGEMRTGEPTIVGLYILHDYRGQGIGFSLLTATINYMLSKNMEPIRLDVMNSKISRMIDRLSIEKQQKLNVVDQSGSLLDILLES